MIRIPAHEQRHRLAVKTLDQVFTWVKEGLGCSQFEAAALSEAEGVVEGPVRTSSPPWDGGIPQLYS